MSGHRTSGPDSATISVRKSPGNRLQTTITAALTPLRPFATVYAKPMFYEHPIPRLDPAPGLDQPASTGVSRRGSCYFVEGTPSAHGARGLGA